MRFVRLVGHCLIFIRRKEVKEMAVIYVALIVKGNKTFADVPALIKAQVRELLIALELEESVAD